MFQNKIKKAVGAVAFAGALLVSGLPVSADTLPELMGEGQVSRCAIRI